MLFSLTPYPLSLKGFTRGGMDKYGLFDKKEGGLKRKESFG